MRPPASERPDVVDWRKRFIKAQGALPAAKLVFIDESGFRTNISRVYGWSRRGTKPTLIKSKYGKNITIVGAIALDGVRAIHGVEGKFDGEGFLTYLDDILGPTLNEGDIVVMDGPNLHRVDGVDTVLASHGATALYLPPYSPELNPIEMCWSVMKARIRKWTPRAKKRLVKAIHKAWDAVTPRLCESWIRHSGYDVAGSS